MSTQEVQNQQYGNSPVTFSKSNVPFTFSGSPIDVISTVFKVENTKISSESQPVLTPECLSALEQPAVTTTVPGASASKSRKIVSEEKTEPKKVDVVPVIPKPVNNKKEETINIDPKISFAPKKPQASNLDIDPNKVQEKLQKAKKVEEYPVEKILLA